MRGSYFFMYTLELLLLLCLSSLDHLEAKPNKHYGRCNFDGDNKAFCRLQAACDTFSADEKNNENFLKEHNCGEADGKPLVCCPETGYIDKLIMEVFESPQVELPVTPYCGSMLKDRIYNGNLTGPDEYPWMALIYTTDNGVSKQVCGGVLITDRWVLTAAHCERDGRFSSVRLGEWNTDTDPDCIPNRYYRDECLPPHIDVPVDLVKVHPSYDKNTYDNDIALLRLAHPVTQTANIKIICLPHTPKFLGDNYEGAAADLSGWGRTETGQVSNWKLKATLGIWHRERCRKSLEASHVVLDERLLCAKGDENVSSCYGDSGGPLMLEDGSFNVIGVLSRGSTGCKNSEVPIVFTRVATYINWIRSTLTDNQ